MAKANLLGKRNREDDWEIKERVELVEIKSDETNFMKAAIREKTLFVTNLNPHAHKSHIIKFFKNIGKVVRVQLAVNFKVNQVGYGYVEFVSANEAKKVLQNKNGEYFAGRNIVLAMLPRYTPRPQPKYCIDHKIRYGEREKLPIEEDETLPDFVEDVVLFVANLSPQTKISHIMDFFSYVGLVVSVRLIVNHESKHVGHALRIKNGEYLHDHQIFLHVTKSVPYLSRHKYNLADMLCYEDYFRRQSLLIEDDETPDFVEAVAIRKKTIFVSNLSYKSKISDIVNFFKDVGEVVHVRLIVNHKCKPVGYGFVEFASTNEANMALEKKKGEYLHNREIFLDVTKIDPYLPRPKWCIDHKVWYEDYLRRESLLIEQEKDEEVEGLDETPYLVEEVAVRKKTLFVDNLSYKTKISHIVDIYKNVGNVCGVRLIVNDRGEHVGCGFVEFASVNEAKKVLLKKNGEAIFLNMVEIASYPLRPKYNLAEKLWYEHYLQLEEDDLDTKVNLKKQKLPIFCGKKITFSDDDS